MTALKPMLVGVRKTRAATLSRSLRMRTGYGWTWPLDGARKWEAAPESPP
jgi:hypothetical protein